MPSYCLICNDCEATMPEFVATIAEREKMTCPDCGGSLSNDYARHETSNFSLKGGNWPGKSIKLGNRIMRERDQE
jgi:predicted nucleic acid-binding Zn ribbon protein